MNTEREAARLEELWAGDFGDAYTERNAAAQPGQAQFWDQILTSHPAQSALEVGCNVGINLGFIAHHVEVQRITGVDINESALRECRRRLPRVNAVWAPARNLPFADGAFDLTFTMGVLIHQPDATLAQVMSEVVRCSRQLVLCGEYFDEQTTEVPYRGQSGALMRRNYGALYRELFPDLRLLESGFLGRDSGWDDITYWLFEKA